MNERCLYATSPPMAKPKLPGVLYKVGGLYVVALSIGRMYLRGILAKLTVIAHGGGWPTRF